MNSKDRRKLTRKLRVLVNQLVDTHLNCLDEIEAGRITISQARADAKDVRAILQSTADKI